MGTDLLFHEVTRGEVLIGHAQQQKPAVEVEDGAHRGLGVPAVLTAGVDDVVAQRPDGGDGLHDVDRAARGRAAEDLVGYGAGRARRLRRVVDETGLAELPREGGRDQRSRGAERREQGVDHRGGPAGDGADAAQRAVDHHQPPARQAQPLQIGREFRAGSGYAVWCHGLSARRRGARLGGGWIPAFAGMTDGRAGITEGIRKGLVKGEGEDEGDAGMMEGCAMVSRLNNRRHPTRLRGGACR